MELNELRQLWHRQDPEQAPPLSERALAGMVARKSESVVATLRRNAWLEVGLAVLVFLALPFGIYYASNRFVRGYWVTFELLVAASFYYYYRKFRLLRGMEHVEKDVRGHLQALIAGLRGLLAFYLRFTLGITVVALLANAVYQAVEFSTKYGGAKLALALGLLAGVMLLAGAVLYWLMAKFTKWYLHQLYGQHLDRLEAYLAELQSGD